MRRWLFAFLLLVVPLQLVWGVAAPYCAHEASASAKKHFGHHEHKHLASGEIVSATEDGDDAIGAYHADCENCHLSCSAYMPSASPVVGALPDGDAIRHPEPRYDSHIPAGPKRPDRAAPTPAARFGGGMGAASQTD